MSEIAAIYAVRRQIRELVDGTLEIKLHVEPQFKKNFLDLFPEIDMPVAIAPMKLTPDVIAPVERELVVPATKGNTLARDMHVNGYFRNPKLWAAMASSGLYKQAYHKAWIESQPCAGRKRAPAIACGGDVCAHHARDASNSGTGIKPDDWFTVPMCNNHHQQWAHGSSGSSITREEREELVTAAVTLTAERMKIAMKKHLGIDSLSDPTFTEVVLEKFHQEIGR